MFSKDKRLSCHEELIKLSLYVSKYMHIIKNDIDEFEHSQRKEEIDSIYINLDMAYRCINRMKKTFMMMER